MSLTLALLCRTFGRRSAVARSQTFVQRKNVRCLTTNSESSAESMTTPTPRHVLSSYERFLVKITRSYKGAEVPTTMGPEAMDRVNSRFRIGLMVVMMTVTLGVCLLAIRQGKNEKAAHSSKMVYSRNRGRYKS